jgi:hypothetical protein
MAGINDHVWLDTPEQWDELAARCRHAGIIGLDTEFYGLDVRKESCVGKARVHVWSVAIRTKRMDPLGFHRARGWVLPAEALLHPSLREMLEDAAVEKCVHNQPVDDHAIHNHGVKLRGCRNTLDLARWAWPHLLSFGLKDLMLEMLHKTPVCEYVDVVRDVRRVTVAKTKKIKVSTCSCGVLGCRKRKGHDKTKSVAEETVFEERDEKYEHPLESIVPGHPRFPLLVDYAAVDAIAALELEELAANEPDPAEFPYAQVRPGFSQGVCDQVVLMERTGFHVDTQYAGDQAEKAEEAELDELMWLRRWVRLNVPEYELMADEEVDTIWSSGPKLLELFDLVEFPRSPVWKKGKVKRGESKLDSAAMEWIAKNYKPAAQIIKHILHLKRIRSSLKYLEKLRDCGGKVHPICGAGSDMDGRFGAKTGRLAIKGVLEAQQLPTREEVDLYQVRRAIVA